MDIILFEDAGVDQLAPLAALRPAYAISCGGQTLIDVVQRSAARTFALVRQFLTEFQSAEFPGVTLVELDSRLERSAWLLNARLLPRWDLIDILERHRLHSANHFFLHNHKLAAAFVNAGTQLKDVLRSPEENSDQENFPQNPHPLPHPLPEPLGLLEYAFDVIRYHEPLLATNLSRMIGDENYLEVADGVFTDPSFRPPDLWATDTTHGPILIHPHVKVRPFAFLQGPLLLGAHATINEHSSLKHGVTVGPYVKVGGEIEASIFESYSNKQHAGFLGHAYVGSWVNLGAGTTNSDLKNTYGTVRVWVGDRKLDTGMQFLGCIIGDYCKTAIGTLLFSGKLLGACSMAYGTVAENVPPFVNYQAAPAVATVIDPDVVVRTQQRMFVRRGRHQLPSHIQLIRDLFERTRAQRVGLGTNAPRFA